MSKDGPGITVTFHAGRTRVSATGLSPEEAEGISGAWSRCSPCSGEPAVSDAVDRGLVFGVHEFRAILTKAAVQAALVASTGRDMLLHGACLASPATGRGVVLCAASGVGKSTATRHLGRTLSYLTDETTIVQPEGLEVVPFPKPLSLLGPQGRYPKDQVSPDDLGLQQPAGPVRLSAIAMLDRRPDATGPRIEDMGLIEALVALAPQTSALAALPRGLVTLCHALDLLGGARRVVYREAYDLDRPVQQLLNEERVPSPPIWTPLPVEHLIPSALTDTGRTPRVRRRGADCGIDVHDGRWVVLTDERLVVLEGLGVAIWCLLEEPRTVPELWEALTARSDPPADGLRLLAAALDALGEEGLVVMDGPSAGWTAGAVL